jgi:RimJ/RimL family protein N-acetyltransferase
MYRRSLLSAARALQQEGSRDIHVEVRPDNAPSIRGIEAAGFRLQRHVDARVLFGAWVVSGGCVRRLSRRP